MSDDLIRWGKPTDAAALADVHVRAWQTAYRGTFSDEFLDSLDTGAREAWWAGYLGRERPVHVAEADGRVIGFCTQGRSAEPGWGEIFAIYVLSDYWGRGFGRRLLVAGESSLLAGGFDRALLWVLEENLRARAFYEREGWARGKPIRMEDIGGTQVTELRYEKDLQGER